MTVVTIIMLSNRCSEATVCLLEGLTLICLILKVCVSRLSSSDQPCTVACSILVLSVETVSVVHHLMLYQSKLACCTF